jgi:hypothetical protein
LEILKEAASEFPTLATPQRRIGNLNSAFEKPTANHLPVILKSNTKTSFKISLNFSPSSPAYRKIYRIIGGFLNATSILKRVS